MYKYIDLANAREQFFMCIKPYLLDGQLAAEAYFGELVQEALGADGLVVPLVERGPGNRAFAAVAHKVLGVPGFAKRR